MLATFKANDQFFFLKSAICQVEFCLFITVCHIAMAISRAHSLWQVSLIFSVT